MQSGAKALLTERIDIMSIISCSSIMIDDNLLIHNEYIVGISWSESWTVQIDEKKSLRCSTFSQYKKATELSPLRKYDGLEEN